MSLVEKIREAKEKLGDTVIPLIIDHYNIEGFESVNKRVPCPFHEDKTPSLVWNDKDHYFKCFSCSRRMGIIDVYIDTEGSYKNAVKRLFYEAQIDYSLSGLHRDKNEHDIPKDYILPKEVEPERRILVEQYSKKRGISPETLDHFGIKQDKNDNIVFEFKDTNNVLLGVKYRMAGEKRFWWQKDCSPCQLLFNMNKVDITQPLVITEGMFDALAVYEAGYRNVVSIPGGANDLSWIEFNFDFLNNFEQIILWFDNDQAGKNAIKEIVPRLSEYRCKIINPSTEIEEAVSSFYEMMGSPKRIIKTDANNVLLSTSKEQVIKLITQAEEVPNKKLKYLFDCEIKSVKDLERTSFGIRALDDLLYGNLFPSFQIWSGQTGCVDCDTEFFDGMQWKKITEYRTGDKVLQYNNDGTATLVEPSLYHKYKSEYLWQFERNKEVNQCLSEEHNIYYISDNKLINRKFSEFMDMHNRSKYGVVANFISTFDYSNKGIKMSDEALIKLFDTTDDRYFKTMKLPRYIYKCNREQLNLICETALGEKEYRGSKLNIFHAISKQVAEFIQFAFTVSGYTTGMFPVNRLGQDCYEIIVRNKKTTQMSVLPSTKTEINQYKTKDGYKYCFTVDSGMWIMRRYGCIAVTGNSGKSSIANISSLIAPMEAGYETFVFSGELGTGQLADWVLTPLAGYNHITESYTSNTNRAFYTVTPEAEKQIREFYKRKSIVYNDEDGLDVSGNALLQEMEYAHKKYGCRMFLIDNLMCLSFENLNEDNKWDSQKKFIIRLMNFSDKFNSCVNLILHPKKPSPHSSGVSAYDLHGASEIGNLCHRLLWVERLNKEEDAHDVAVKVIKDRPTQASGKECKLYYDNMTRRVFSTLDELYHTYEWEQSCGIEYSKEVLEKLILKNKITELPTDPSSLVPF